MKVREKFTGDIIEVTPIMKHNERYGQFFESVEDEVGRELNLKDVEVIESKDTSIPDCGEGAICIDPSISYWDKLLHQYAGMALSRLVELVNHGYEYVYEEVAILAINYATALVEKLKEKEERK